MRRKKQLETISMEEFARAGLNWQQFWIGRTPYKFDFYDFLGITNNPPKEHQFQVTHHIARKVRLLNSPHHHAFLMAYKLRKEHKG